MLARFGGKATRSTESDGIEGARARLQFWPADARAAALAWERAAFAAREWVRSPSAAPAVLMPYIHAAVFPNTSCLRIRNWPMTGMVPTMKNAGGKMRRSASKPITVNTVRRRSVRAARVLLAVPQKKSFGN